MGKQVLRLESEMFSLIIDLHFLPARSAERPGRGYRF